MNKYFLLPIMISLVLLNCEKNITNPETTHFLASFEKAWNDFDQNYSYFIYKNINWDSIKTAYRPLVQNSVAYDDFINHVLKGMLKELRDLHVSLKDKNGKNIPLYIRIPAKNYQYDNKFYYKYLTNIVNTTNSMFKFATINDNIGYILIYNWKNEDDVNEFQKIFDNYQSLYENHKGLIIDVRSNFGGNESLARYVAGRFSKSINIYAYRKYRNGPKHDDFTPLQSIKFFPSGSWQYTKPVILLIGEACVSSNEAFIMMMSTLNHVTTVGDTTGGSSGNPKEYS